MFPALSTGTMPASWISSVAFGQLYTSIFLGIPADTMLLRKWVCQGLVLRHFIPRDLCLHIIQYDSMWLVGIGVNKRNEYHDCKNIMSLLLLLQLLMTIVLMTIVFRWWWRWGSSLRSRDRQTSTHDVQNRPYQYMQFPMGSQSKKASKLQVLLIELCSTGNCLVSHWASQAQSGQPACCVPFSLPSLWQLSAVSFLLPIVASKHLLPLLHTRCIWKRVVCQLLASQERNRYQVIHLLSDTNPYSIVLLVASYPFMCLENCVITLTYTYTSMHIYV